jgi:parallel beta-helix repeat protein
VSKLNIWQNSRTLRLALALAFGLALLIGLLLAMGAARPPDVALAQGPTIRYVAPAPTGNDSGNDCTSSSTPCATVQHAVDVADPGDEIRVATGTYSGVQGRPVPAGYPAPPASGTITQVVYISQTVTLRGGYTTTFTDPPDPEANPTTLDAQKQGRVLYITGDISPTVEGLRITGGDAVGLGGSPSGDSGGGVLAISATITMSNNQVFSNTATFGGGLYLYDSANATLISNMISHNKGWTHAGGLYFRNSSRATLISNTISDNEAPSPWGLYGGARFAHSDNATLINNIISGNHAADQCGGGDVSIRVATPC